MEKVINVDFLDESDIVSRYDGSKISNDLIEYLIKEAEFVRKKDSIKIIISNKCKTKIKYKEMLYNAFNEAYTNNLRIHAKNNIIQVILFILGVFFIFMSFQIKNELWEEIFLIGGWVPIWEMVDLELFSDVRGNRRKHILLKLKESEIVEDI